MIQFSLQSFHLICLFWPVIVIYLTVAISKVACKLLDYLGSLPVCLQCIWDSGCPGCFKWAVCEWSVGQLWMGDEWVAEHRARLQPRNTPLWGYGCKPLRCYQAKQQIQCPVPACLLQVIIENVFSFQVNGHLRCPGSVLDCSYSQQLFTTSGDVNHAKLRKQ